MKLRVFSVQSVSVGLSSHSRLQQNERSGRVGDGSPKQTPRDPPGARPLRQQPTDKCSTLSDTSFQSCGPKQPRNSTGSDRKRHRTQQEPRNDDHQTYKRSDVLFPPLTSAISGGGCSDADLSAGNAPAAPVCGDQLGGRRARRTASWLPSAGPQK